MEESLKSVSIQAILAFFILLVCFYMLAFQDPDETLEARIIDIILVVVSFYFGASHGSKAKNKMLEQKDSVISDLAKKQ